MDILNSTTWKKETIKDGDLFDVEVGDSKQPDFKPQVKIKRWDNECNFSVRRVEDRKGVISEKDGIVKAVHSDIEDHFYEKPDGFEFETLLKTKPKSNVISYTIEKKGLDFFYQPALTQEEIDDGCERPENVVGSYAVYHNSKANNEYKAGKAFHIYRPEIIDADGNKVWGELNIDKELTVTIPQDFLDKAVYPVIVDPTFGYTTAGGSNAGSLANTVRGHSIFAPGEDGNVTIITAYLENYYDGDDSNVRGVLYQDSDNGLITYGSAITLSDTPTWEDMSVTEESITVQNYLLGYWIGNEHARGFYDTVAGYAQYRDNETYHATNPPPSTLSQDTIYSSRKYSIYATYTTGDAGSSPSSSPSSSVSSSPSSSPSSSASSSPSSSISSSPSSSVSGSPSSSPSSSVSSSPSSSTSSSPSASVSSSPSSSISSSPSSSPSSSISGSPSASISSSPSSSVSSSPSSSPTTSPSSSPSSSISSSPSSSQSSSPSVSVSSSPSTSISSSPSSSSSSSISGSPSSSISSSASASPSGFYDNNEFIIDTETGALCLNLDNSKINNWTNATRPSSPQRGMIGFNTNTSKLEIYDGTSWKVSGDFT